jgi:hypothetical protein
MKPTYEDNTLFGRTLAEADEPVHFFDMLPRMGPRPY